MSIRKEIFLRFSFLISVLILISLLKGWLIWSGWPLWVGGVVGVFLPDIDHLIYVFFLNPLELTSQRAVYLIRQKDYRGAIRFLLETRRERKDLVLHTNLALAIFLVLAFWLLTSSGSFLGNGLILGILVHFAIDRMQKALYDKRSWPPPSPTPSGN